jgi:hypothetical protein
MSEEERPSADGAAPASESPTIAPPAPIAEAETVAPPAPAEPATTTTSGFSAWSFRKLASTSRALKLMLPE